MNWTQMSKYRIESPEGYIISKSKVDEDSTVYVARAPRVVGHIYAGHCSDEAKAACDEHWQTLVEVRVCDLQRPALNWAVAEVVCLKVAIGTNSEGLPLCMLGNPSEGRVYDPAGDWEQGGQLFDEHGITDADLAAGCRAIVERARGGVVQVPAVLVGVVGG